MNQSLEKLLAGFIDYAGLFPPAGLSMNDAVAEFAAHLRHDHAWVLSRFVVPAARLADLGAHLAALEAGPKWSLSVLLAITDLEAGAAHISNFETTYGELARVGSIEVAAGNTGHIAAVNSRFGHLPRYFEIASLRDPGPLIRAISQRGGAAKIRTGGIVEEAFPSAGELARFVVAVHRSGVPFKATAGLHHPLRGRYPLTYDEDAAEGHMHGFLNLMIGAALMSSGRIDEQELEFLLATCQSASQLIVDTDSITWQGHRLSREQIERTRRDFFHSIGSCSIVEPLQGLREVESATRDISPDTEETDR